MARPEVSGKKLERIERRRPKTPREFIQHWRMSRNTYERMHLRGDGPRRTYLTPNKHVITPEAEDEWAASRPSRGGVSFDAA